VQSDLGFPRSGRYRSGFIDAGQTVTRGQPLMRIDPSI
jgi:multidrug efflux pump subunit AcrA (membrane-fusion protein)